MKHSEKIRARPLPWNLVAQMDGSSRAMGYLLVDLVAVLVESLAEAVEAIEESHYRVEGPRP